MSSRVAAMPVWRGWAGFIAMSIGMFMAVLDIQIVASSLPEIQSALRIPLDRLGWVQTAYLSAEIVAIPLTGWITRALRWRSTRPGCCSEASSFYR